MEGYSYLLGLALSCIRFLGEIVQEFKKIRRLMTEQAVIGKGFYSTLGDSNRSRWPND